MQGREQSLPFLGREQSCSGKDICRMQPMAGHSKRGEHGWKCLEQTRVRFLVCKHWALGSDWAVTAGAITQLWAGG